MPLPIDPELLDAIASLHADAFDGTVWRHMFADNPPERANTGGARWNPAGVDAIYSSIERETAIGEGDFRAQIEPLRPRAKRTLYELHLRLASVVDLTVPDAFESLGLIREDLEDIEMTKTQMVGGAVEWLGHDGLLVPSLRVAGTNLLVFANRMLPDGLIERVASEVISEPTL